MSRVRGFEIVPGYEDIATIPTRKTKKSAGYDIHAAISQEIRILPGEMVPIETGITVYMQDNEEFQIRPRSGLGLKSQITLQNSPATIDADFHGNPFIVLLRNEGKQDFVVGPGMRIAQGVFSPYLITDDDHVETERTGGLGHTGL